MRIRNLKNRHLCFMMVALSPVAFYMLLNWAFPLPVEKLHPSPSTIVLDRDGHLLQSFLAPDEMWRFEVSAEEISPILKKTVLTYEDKYFYWHLGINPFSVLRAALSNFRAGRIVQGGSTITMQVARMMEPKNRTFWNKLVEAFCALQLEWYYSKNEILTFYFNLAPYGGNLVGIGAASYFYFNKSPDKLSLGEAAILAAIPNSPNLYRPDMNPGAAANARKKILNLLRNQDIITVEQRNAAESESIPQKRYSLPLITPHLAVQLKQMYPQVARLQTTIEQRMQNLAKDILHTYLKPWESRGVSNGAVVIIENQSQDLRALVGSKDFFDDENQGQVNGALAPRSPGSALKPFIYSLGVEHGLISPQSLLNDVPVEYAGYEPVNYDELYHGAVSVEEALIRSLNVPAVNLYAKLGENGIYSFLKETGISTLSKSKDYYGLSLILGGCEMTLFELTNLYTGLANGGRFRPVRFLKSQKMVEGKPLLSPGTCFIITEILAQLRRPELPSVWEASMDMPKVAWKTGTSYGHRDAWSLGYTPEYTIGVWVGNFDGKGVPALVGADVAAPIMFALFNALAKTSGNRWFVQPENVEGRQVCAISGMPKSKFCVATRNELYIPGISPHQRCSIHKLILVDKITGQRLCSHCRINRDYSEQIYEIWPAEIATWLVRNGAPQIKLPEHFSKCSKVVTGEGPIIRSPSANNEYKIRTEVDLKYQNILLDASVSNQTKTIYWFLNGRLIFSGSPNAKVFFPPRKGKHNLMCMDDEGRSSEVKIIIN